MNENILPAAAGGTGFLVVQVGTAGNAIPLSGAAVTIRESNSGTVLYELRSDRDGRTERVELPAPARALSMSPSEARPYAVYNIEVRLSGYEKADYQNVPIFDGITAIQQADLRPIPANGTSGDLTLNGGRRFEGEEPQLWRE
ncbi:MAG: hypothetical protein E7590_09150 [Ruminococcaceae bacterium]|nr:hypothetical protein [Oscillospiraceae bacterium]